MRPPFIAVPFLCLVAIPASAQYYPIPNEVSIGLGGVRDDSTSRTSPSMVGSITFDDKGSWAALVIEGELGVASDVESCEGMSYDDLPDSCLDAVVLGGLRFRQRPYEASGLRPFGEILLGEYWTGSGREDEDDASRHFAMQVGGGVEFRWPGSFHGVRLSLDYRRVYAGARDRDQVRVLIAYVLGPRRFKRASD